MKKILHVVGGMDVGGTETMLMNLYRDIDRKKYEFHFISYYEKEGFYDKEIKKLGGKIINLSSCKRLGTLRSALELIKIIKKNNYDVVHTHTLFNCGIGVLCAWLGGTKVRISHAHTVLEERKSLIRDFYTKMMRKFIEIFSTDYLSCSDKAGAFLFGEKILSNKKYKFIPNYVDYKRYLNTYSKEITKKLQIDDKTLVIGHVGRFISSKNHQFILEIIKNIKDRGEKVKGIFLGDGELKKDIEKKIVEYSLENDVILTGVVNNTEVYMRVMDIFILPSLYEGFGLVLLEAQGSGIPCIVSTEIQNEVDLEIDLLEKYNLNLGVEKWSDIVLETMKNKRYLSKEQIENGFIKKGYGLKDILNKLEDVYQGEK